MPKFLEKKLKKEYGAKSKTPFKIMNRIGAMRGSKETAKGRAMSKKHAAKMAGGKKRGKRNPAASMSTKNFEKKFGDSPLG